MTIEERADRSGVDVHLDAEECELFITLALDAERASGGTLARSGWNAHTPANYFSVSLALGTRIRELMQDRPSS